MSSKLVCSIATLAVVLMGFPWSLSTAQTTESDQLKFLTVTVTDKEGRAISGLKEGDIEIYEEGKRCVIKSFSAADEPATIGFLVDTSNSMRSFRLASRAWFGEAIADFLRRSHPSNEYFVLSFNTQVQLLQDYTKDHQRVLDIIANGPMTGLTALLNAIYSGLSKVEQKVGKKVLVLFTDGDENASALSTKELERAVGMSDVLIYPVLIGPLPQRESFMERPTLRPFAQLTGGTVSSCQQKSDCVKGLQELAAELRSQYRIGYVPLQPLDKQGWQKVAVKVPKKSDVGKLKARARQKYLAKP